MGKLVDAARGYLGVKWRHRGRSQHGVDCAGLGILAYRDCGVELPDFLMYGREPHNDGLVTYMTAALGEPAWQSDRGNFFPDICDGDVIVLRFDREPHHVAIIADAVYGDTITFNIIHAHGSVGRVVEQRLTLDVVQRITHVYRKGVL